MRKKYKKINHRIIESIRYARLQKELNIAKRMNEELEDKSNILSFINKKKKENDNYIENINQVINDIETTYKPKVYNIVIENNLGKYLKKLSKCNNFEIVKYNIAINMILDNTVEYQYSDDFFEYISKILFQDKNMMKTTQKKLSEIYFRFNNESSTDKTTEVTKHIPINMNMALRLIKTKFKKLPGPLVIQGVLFAFGKGKNLIQKKRQIRRLKQLSDTEFEYMLTITLLRLTYGKNALSELEYKSYFESELKTINAIRTRILKEFYEEWYDVEDNLNKINLLHIFEDYLIIELKFYV